MHKCHTQGNKNKKNCFVPCTVSNIEHVPYSLQIDVKLNISMVKRKKQFYRFSQLWTPYVSLEGEWGHNFLKNITKEKEPTLGAFSSSSEGLQPWTPSVGTFRSSSETLLVLMNLVELKFGQLLTFLI